MVNRLMQKKDKLIQNRNLKNRFNRLQKIQLLTKPVVLYRKETWIPYKRPQKNLNNLQSIPNKRYQTASIKYNYSLKN